MTPLRTLLARLRELTPRFRDTFHATRDDDDLREELRLHMEMAECEARLRGQPLQGRRRDVMLATGVSPALEAMRAQRGLPALADFAQSVRHACRSLRRSPNFALCAVLSLALGIGANVAMFALADALLFRPLPVRSPDRLVQVSNIDPSDAARRLRPVLPGTLDAIRDAHVFTGVCGFLAAGAALELRGQTTSVPVLVVSGDCFETLGVHAALGRLIEPADDRREADRVIAISYESWQNDFDGRSDVLGQRVRLDDGDSFQIVGVVARSFRGLVIGFPPRIYVPVRQVKLPSRVPYASLGQTVFARLRDGETTTGAAVRLETEWAGYMAASIPTELSGTEREHHLAQRPVVGSAATGLDYSLRARFSKPITSLLLIASLALLLCALNVANLLRARAADQRRETAVRLALGGTRWHIARQMLLESTIILSAAVVTGLVVGYWCDRLLIATFQSSSPNFSIDVTPDVRTFVFASGATIVAFLVFAIGPALTSSNVDAIALRSVSTRTTGDFVQRGRVGLVLQVVMTLIVVANGAAFVDALSSLRHAPLGIDLERVLAVQLRGLPGGYVNGWGPTSYYRTLVDRMRDIPGVMAASLSADPPLGRGSRPVDVTVASAEMIGIDAEEILVTDRFFETMKIPLLAGEDFRPADTARVDRTVIVSESLARRLFGSGNPLGRRIRTGTNPELATPADCGDCPRCRPVASPDPPDAGRVPELVAGTDRGAHAAPSNARRAHGDCGGSAE